MATKNQDLTKISEETSPGFCGRNDHRLEKLPAREVPAKTVEQVEADRKAVAALLGW